MSNLLFKLDAKCFGFPIEQVKDVLPIPSITKVPLANKEILGVFNLRGEIVTAIDLATILEKEKTSSSMIIVTEFANDLYGFAVSMVDGIIDSPDESMTILHPKDLLTKYFKTSAETY
jgi:purine-binding chemotaxis protein CheW